MINWKQSSMFEYNTGDPLPTDITEGIRAYNIDTGEKNTMVDGQWKAGWYSHYIDIPVDLPLPVAGVQPEHMKGLPTDMGSMAGYVLTLDDSLTSWDLRPLESNVTNTPMYLTKAQLVSRIAARDVEEDDIYRLIDEGNRRIKIAYISLPGGEAWYETMSSSGQLSHMKIQ